MHERGAADRPPLHVGILADMIDRPGGIARYTDELVAALGRRNDVRLIVAAHAGAAGTARRLAAGNLHAMLTVPDRGQLGIAVWERYASGSQFVQAGAEIIHGTKHLVPRTTVPTVLTVHDVMTITRAHESSLAKRLVLPRQYRTSLNHATRLVATSRTTRDRLRDIDPAWGPKTVVVPNGLSLNLVDTRPEPVPSLVATNFALVVGDLAPRKNVGMLLNIWEDVARTTPGFRLVVLGHPGPHSAETTGHLARLVAAGLAVWLRGADDAQLRWCYEHSTVVLFPTLEEGFGFPLIEALTFGAPVLASTDPALVEVAAGADGVVHLDATDPDAWRRAIATAAIVPRSPPGAPQPPPDTLTWDEYAAMLMPVYRALARPQA